MARPTSSRIADYLRVPTFIIKDEPLCSQVDPELFFPEEKEYAKASYYRDIKAAKDICSKCPLALECLEYALINHPIQGVWGGLTEPERTRLVSKRRAN